MPAAPLRYLLLGEQSLLVRCAGRLIGQGHEVVAIVTEDRRIREWAAGAGVPCFWRYEELQAAPPAGGFDYLLSITNLRILPEWLLRMPRVGAINFHDGPLPRYAGLNAPVWALLAGETTHGVVWHELTGGVDRGGVLAREDFAVDAQETAFGLNAQCYQAGYESFAGLLERIEAGTLQAQVQDESQRSWFGMNRRPPGAGCLDWTRDAQDLERQVRALDFGPYPNPVLLPRIDLGDSLLLVREASTDAVLPGRGPPGQLIRTADGQAAVRCGHGALVLRRVTTLDGADVDAADALAAAGFAADAVLPAVAAAPDLDALVRHLATHEAWWLRQFRQFEPTPAPYARRDAAGSAAAVREIGPGMLDADGMLAALALLLARLANRREFAVAHVPASLAAVEAGARRFVAPRAVLRAEFGPGESFADWRAQLAAQQRRCEERVGWQADLAARQTDLSAPLSAVPSLPVLLRRVASLDDAPAPSVDAGHVLVATIADDGACRLADTGRGLAPGALDRLCSQLATLATRVAVGSLSCTAVSILDAQDERCLTQWSGAAARGAGAALPRIHEQFEAQVARDPDRRACVHDGQVSSYAQLNAAANRVAALLLANGVRRGDRVGLRIPRGMHMVAGLLGVLKAGAAYVPLDPAWPQQRLDLMAGDAAVRCVLGAADVAAALAGDHAESDPGVAGDPSDLAYVIYTSGSTGRPKGVMVEHRQVTNFFAGIDARFGTQPGTWLAVTSISFDISVLELLWTLARGFTVVLHGDALRLKGDAAPTATAPAPAHAPAFGLFYWNVAKSEADYDADKYRLLLESARFADTHGFNAVWTPERHFEAFGGLFPNPSVTSAALATITRNVQLRAGSCVVPLHSPIRIAEEWAVVDNLSNGRVGISVAAGWAMPDFAIRPENFANAKQVMFESTAILRRLWRGETVPFPGPKGEVQVRTLPRPVQKELPVWVTTAGNPETWIQAGVAGANVLTHLLGQTVEEVAGKVAAYRKAWADAGHPGRGIVTLMLHTLVGTDEAEVERTVRQPMKDYLRSAVALVKAAAWQFPTFRRLSDATGRTLDEFFAGASEQDMDDLLEFAFQRYFRDSGLFGTPQSCLAMVGRVNAADIDEIACLIDFGIATDTVLAHLPHLDELRRLAQQAGAADASAAGDQSLAGLLRGAGITHLQCTPAMATMLVADADAREGLAGLRELMVGGEALTPELARELSRQVRGRISNMYGPTETTVWSTVGTVDDAAVTPGNGISIGTPLLNQSVHILDDFQQPLPPGITGEIVIGGAGVTRGYWRQPELTAQRFTGDPPMYRTGDLGRLLPDGRIECLGRGDQQVKIRGYRVEPGEIEAALREQPGIAEAAVVLRELAPGDRRLFGFVRLAAGGALDEPQLRRALARRLPDYMVPSAIHVLAAMPLTPNGKLDRKALAVPARRLAAAPTVDADTSRAATPAATTAAAPQPAPDVEQAVRIVLEAWRRALGIEDIGLRDNFFDIGGHSLLVIQVLKELREQFPRPIQMTDLFRHTTVEALARFLGEGGDRDVSAARGRSRADARRAAMNRRG